MTAPVTLSGVNHWFGSFHALQDIALDIHAGEYVTLLGPSGCGKTTLLSVLGGFIEPSEGRVEIGGQDMTRVAPAKRPTTTMFQDYALFPHMNLRDNVSFGLRMARVSRTARHAKATELLALVGLADAYAKRPHELSGGQRQRVALARALAVEPDVLLLDEPLGALDLKLRRAMQDELKGIQRQVGTTFVHVTHDQEEAMAIADRIVVMNAGRIEDQGPAERIYQQPASLFAADFMGEMNHIPGRVTELGIETALRTLPGRQAALGEGTVCIRPEAIRIDGTAHELGEAQVIDAAFFGSYIRVHLSAAGDTLLTAHLSPQPLPAVGRVVPISVDPEAVLVFPKEDP